jgi:hypothetical protein
MLDETMVLMLRGITESRPQVFKSFFSHYYISVSKACQKLRPDFAF